MRPKSQTLFHFTRSLDTLKQILLGGFWPRYSLEDFRWQSTGPDDIDFAAVPMVCFCDIPLSRLDEHVEFYGHYGVGLSRAWGERSGLNPLLYIAGANTIAASLIHLAEVSRKHADGERALAQALLHHTASFLKPVSGLMTVATGQVEKDFYQESEWRYVPSHPDLPQLLLKDQFGDPRFITEANAKSKEYAMLRFAPSDVRYLFVKTDAEIPPIINFIQSALDSHSNADIKTLMSRVTSLETLRSDW
jgi:hypothetical protein